MSDQELIEDWLASINGDPTNSDYQELIYRVREQWYEIQSQTWVDGYDDAIKDCVREMKKTLAAIESLGEQQ